MRHTMQPCPTLTHVDTDTAVPMPVRKPVRRYVTVPTQASATVVALLVVVVCCRPGVEQTHLHVPRPDCRK